MVRLTLFYHGCFNMFSTTGARLFDYMKSLGFDNRSRLSSRFRWMLESSQYVPSRSFEMGLGSLVEAIDFFESID